MVRRMKAASLKVSVNMKLMNLFYICVFSVLVGGTAVAGGLSQEATHNEVANFELKDVDDRLHRLSDYEGKWVIVNFWATWCGPCIKEIPELTRFYHHYREKGVMVIGINFEELPVERLKQAIDEFAIDYPVLRIGSVPLVPFEPLKGLPSTFAVSPQGRLVKSWLGPVDEKVLQTYIEARLVSN